MRRLWTRQRRRRLSGKSMTVPAAGLINGHLGVQRGMLGRGRGV